MSYQREVRFGEGKKFRAFTLYSHGGVTISSGDTGGSGLSAASFAKKYSAGEMARLAQRERIHAWVPPAQMKRWFKEWRTRCIKDGLTTSVHVEVS